MAALLNGDIFTMKKSQIPSKLCPICKRPFTWRKKWEKVWPEVKYCSKRCKALRYNQKLGE